jgi:hypothetical protein
MNKEQAFWNWFVRHNEQLKHFERNRDAVFDALATQLEKVNRDLTFEFGPLEDGSREFVISAGGIKTSFSAVESLAAAAPELSGWNVTAFRPRRPLANVIELGDYRIDPEQVQYSLLRAVDDLGIYLFIPGYSEGDSQLRQIGYLLLDEALGEYDVEMKLRLIKMYSPESDTPGPRYALRELPEHFDAVNAELRPGS